MDDEKLIFFLGGIFVGAFIVITPTMMLNIIYCDITYNMYTAILCITPFLICSHILKVASED